MHFGLIIIGDEILSGKRQDKHMAKVIELLAQRGLALSHVDYVGDDRPRITEALRRAFASGDQVFSCGGIGATPDDHTRQCAAQALQVPLLPHPQAQALIRERMQDTAREQGVPFEPERADNVQRLQMGVFPQGASIIPNPYNKIPGFSCAGANGGAVHFAPRLPGHGVADDRMGAGAALHAVVPPPTAARAVGRAVWRDGVGADAADAADRGAPSRSEGFQPAQRRSPGTWRAHRARGQGRGRARAAGVE